MKIATDVTASTFHLRSIAELFHATDPAEVRWVTRVAFTAVRACGGRADRLRPVSRVHRARSRRALRGHQPLAGRRGALRRGLARTGSRGRRTRRHADRHVPDAPRPGPR